MTWRGPLLLLNREQWLWMLPSCTSDAPGSQSGSDLEENITVHLVGNSEVIQLRNLDDEISEQKKKKKKIQAVLYLAKNV